MKKTFYFISTLIVLVCAIVFFSKCSKTNIMTITNISPTTAQAGGLTEVTITGTNFENKITSMLVNLGGVNILPNSATATELKFYVLSDVRPGTHKIEVINFTNNSSIKSTQDFIVSPANTIKITSISPNTFSLANGAPQTIITISGSGFNTDKNKMGISFGNISLLAYSSSSTSLTFIINKELPGIQKGTFKIGVKDFSTSNDEVKSSQDFTITD